MARYSIGEVAAATGLKRSAIRYYEDEGLIPAPARSSGRRVYGEEVFDHLAIIGLAQAAGFSIKEIRGLKQAIGAQAEPGQHWRRFAHDKLAELDAQIDTAQRMKQVLHAVMRCECASLVDCARMARTTAG